MKFPVAPALAALLLASTPVLRAQAPEPPAAPEKKPDAPEKSPAPEKPADAPTPPAEPPPKPAKPRPTLPKPGEPLTTRRAVDTLTDAELDQVIALLKDNYIDPDALSDDEIKRASVQGLIDRIAPGAALAQAPAPGAVQPSPFRAEILDARIGYARLGATVPANVGELDAALQNFTEKKLGALILDLRATPASSEFEQTAEVCRRFCPKGKVLFSVKKPNL